MFSSYSTSLCNYVISKQQKDLLVIFENFMDKVTDPETNIFFVQNSILDTVLTNIENCNKQDITFEELFKGVDEQEKEIISYLGIEDKLTHNASLSSILEIEYFNEELFMETLDEELKSILVKYNLKGNDDYNKLYKFLSSIQLTLQSSDDVLSTLKNQYIFFKEHANDSKDIESEEVITIYGNKHYKIDILKNLIDLYKEKIQNKSKKVRRKKGSR